MKDYDESKEKVIWSSFRKNKTLRIHAINEIIVSFKIERSR